ncbi:MAG: S9 family peptidase [Ilumatobacteraceae bacterium]|nr:S9 family peptidase [Ilumatobacteraceae bacterium]
MTSESFPRLFARTQRFTLGEPRNLTVSPDGSRIVFARSALGTDKTNALWVLDVSSGTEHCVADPATLLADDTLLTAHERQRRERAREGAAGITTYACDASVSTATFVLGGVLFVCSLVDKTPPRAINIAPGIFDPRLDPAGKRIAYIRGGDLCISTLDGDETILCTDANDAVTWGAAEFIAAEEMGRQCGYWWSPTGTHIMAERVDNGAVNTWFIADPASPALAAIAHRYPAAGTTNATTSLHVLDISTSSITPIDIAGAWEYITAVHWSKAGCIVQVQTRDQRDVTIFDIDTMSGACTQRYSDSDSCWVELVSGTPGLTSDNQLVTCADRDGARRLLLDNLAITPPDMQVRSIAHVGKHIVFHANPIDTPSVLHIWSYDVENSSLTCIHDANVTSTAVSNGEITVARIGSATHTRATFRIISAGHETDSGVREIVSNAEPLPFLPTTQFHRVGDRAIPIAVVTPRSPGTSRLPVLFDPYGGPHAQRVVASAQSFATSQWFADQGFIVVVVDGAGTPGLGTKWERSVHHDLASAVLADQVEVALVLSRIEPRADLSRVGIRGWSFGGYLAALAVLRRPDIFHCAVAGAPVTDWMLYDTHYTERYLGHPQTDSHPYDFTSLINDADKLSRPLLLIHGLSDDNVIAAHTLQLSSALLAAGKPHEVLPLSGVTHMTPQEIIAENLLLHQLSFLQRHLCQ